MVLIVGAWAGFGPGMVRLPCLLLLVCGVLGLLVLQGRLESIAALTWPGG